MAVAAPERRGLEWRWLPCADVARLILDGLFAGTGPASDQAAAPDRGVPERLDLARFQAEGAARAGSIVARHGGAILADSVGLGKTYMGLALVERMIASGGEAVVVVPASLRTLWRAPLQRLDVPGSWRLVSHTQLARGISIRAPVSPRLVVVDEAHRFRNPGTLRYAALARLTEHAAGVLLITATPINNRPADLYHLLRLFARDDAFADVGIASLRSVFEEPGTPSTALAAVLRAVMVRRTRFMVRERFGMEAGRFPRRAPPRIVSYEDPRIPSRALAISGLELAPYSDGTPVAPAAGLLRLGLLKRLESSTAAFERSVARLARLYRDALDAARAGRVLDIRPRQARGRRDDDPLQLSLISMVAREAPPHADLDGLVASMERDMAALRGLAGGPDPKLAALVALLREVDGEKVVVFSEYRDTAEHLWRHLSDDFRVGRVDGGGGRLGKRRAGRRTVVDRFSPRANGRRAPPDRERVDVLIATDVLAEGVNLQDARHVVTYDLPWNPVRLLQRIGRIDRMGSPHEVIVPHLFVPGQGLEELLGLARRLRAKLGTIAEAVGDEHVDDLLDQLLHATRGPPHRLERVLRDVEAASVEPLERLRTLWVRHRERAAPDPGPAPIVGVLHVPDGHPALRLRAVALAVRNGADGRLLLQVDRSGTTGDADGSAVDTLSMALRCSRTRPKPTRARAADVRAILINVDRHLRTLAARANAPPLVSRNEPGARLARHVRLALARAGTAVAPQVIRQAAALLDRLAAPIAAAADGRVEEVLERLEPATATVDLPDLVARGTAALGRRPDEPAERTGWSVAALLLVERDRPLQGASPAAVPGNYGQ